MTKEKTTQKKPGELNFIPSKNYAFGKVLDHTTTPSGLVLPNREDSPSPLVELYAVGESFENYQEGDIVYVNVNYVSFAMIDGVKGVIITYDAILGKVKES